MNQPNHAVRQPAHTQPWITVLLTCVLTVTMIGFPSLASAQGSNQPGDEEGVLIVRVSPDSPAADAGLRRGDIILSVDGDTVNSAADLMEAIAAHESGDEIELTYLHGSEELTVTAVLADVDGHTLLGVQPYQEAAQMQWNRQGQPSTGMELPEGMAPYQLQNAEAGAQIVEVMDESPAADAGLEVGDVITAVDGEEVAGPEALVEQIGGYAPDETVTLSVTRGNEELDIDVTLAPRQDDAERGYLGVQIGPVFAMGMDGQGVQPFQFNLPPGGNGMGWNMTGVIIQDVAEGSPAAEAGLQPGDWISEVNGETVESFEDLRAIIDESQPGDELELTVQSLGAMPMFRRGAQPVDPSQAQSRTVSVTLGETDEGNAFLGITAAPMRMQMERGVPMMPQTPDCPCAPGQGEDSGVAPHMFFFRTPGQMPNIPFFHHNGPTGEEGVDLYFHGVPNRNRGGQGDGQSNDGSLKITPAQPAAPLSQL